MKSSLQYIIAACAVATVFSGCEWGGSHGDTWNDAYSWANFTGTYRLLSAVKYVDTSAASEDDAASDEEAVTMKAVNGTANSSMATDNTANGKLNAGSGVVPGTVKMTIGGVSLTDDSAGKLLNGGEVVGTVDYQSGAWSISALSVTSVAKGTKIAIVYQYKVPNGSNPSSGGAVNAVAISYLDVVQKGNTLTMTSDRGVKYTGRITGTSMGAESYTQAQDVTLSFEVSAGAAGTMVGSFTGTWSGAADLKSGTMTDRKLNATHSRGGNLVGVAADKTIIVPDVTVSE